MTMMSNAYRTVGASATGLALAAVLAAPAHAQAPSGDRCEVPREASGLIRGDRVPTGCVMTEPRVAPTDEEEATIVLGHTVVLVPVLVGPRKLFFSDPPFVGVPPGPGAAKGAEGLPRVRSGNFGPILRPFGPVTQPFRPTNTDFDRATRTPSRSTRPASESDSSASRTP